VNIFKVDGSLVCTDRHPGMEQLPLRILRDAKGKIQVAIDTIGTCDGNWVFAVSGSAARQALGKEKAHIITDLTICGIIDLWDEDLVQKSMQVKSETLN